MEKILERYIPVADIISKTFGEDCEVVIHDLSDPQHSVVYVANNRVTGRQVGESFDLLVKTVMFSQELKDGYVANYYFPAKNGHMIRSSTLLIYSDGGDVKGAICINVDTTRIAEQVNYLQQFLPGQQAEQPGGIVENDSVDRMVTNLIDRILGDIDPKATSREYRIEKIRFMDSKGIFLMKGSIDLVAEKMGVNKITIYSYLDEARGKR